MRDQKSVSRTLHLVLVALALVACSMPMSAQGGGGQGRGQGRGQAPPPGGRGGGGGQPPRDPRTTGDLPTGTSSITGTVVVAGSGIPARRARVSVSSDGLRSGRSTTTDDQGRYAFVNLPAGRFTLSASKTGYLGVTYGQRQAGSGRPGTPVQLEDGQRLNIQLQMPRGGVLSGIVLDEIGEAIPGTQVRVFRYVLQGGVRTLSPAGSGSTDDRGMYRVYGLPGGDYLICATPRMFGPGGDALGRIQEVAATLAPQAGAAGQQIAAAVFDRIAAAQDQAQAQAGAEQASTGYAPVYYPGTTMTSNAMAVPLAIGEERLGVDFQLQLVPTARVEGMVVFPANQAPGGLQVQLLNLADNAAGLGTTSTRAGSDGRFSFSNVAPGQYTLFASTGRGGMALGNVVLGDGALAGVIAGRGGRGGPGAPVGPGGGAPQGRGGATTTEQPRLWASADISVDGRNLSNQVLALQPAFTVSGRLEFKPGATATPTDLTRLRVSLSPADSSPAARQMASTAAGSVDENGRFTIEGVMPGHYRVTAAGVTGWSLGSAVAAGQEALDFPLDIRAAIPGLVLTFTDQQTSVSGVVTTAQGQPSSDYTLIVYSSDRRYWSPQSRRIRSVRPATDGTFSITGLPPGDYRITPVIDPEPGAWFDAGFLEQLTGPSSRFSLAAGEKATQNVTVTELKH